MGTACAPFLVDRSWKVGIPNVDGGMNKAYWFLVRNKGIYYMGSTLDDRGIIFTNSYEEPIGGGSW